MTKRLLSLAKGKVFCTLEGGYVGSVLGKCVESVVRVLMGEEWDGLKEIDLRESLYLEGLKKGDTEDILSQINPSAANSIRATMRAHEKYWKLFQTSSTPK